MPIAKLTSQQLAELFPQYTNIEEIATGGFKTVYRSELSGNHEAIKVVSIPVGSKTEDASRFREECIGRIKREVAILSDCKSPFMVKLASLPLQHHEIDGLDFVIYSEEFLEGINLWDAIRSNEPLPLESDVKILTACLLKAIEELWSLKCIHRDIKPPNVIRLNHPDRPFVLIDLGIAFSLQDTALTFNAGDRAPMATFRYIAPEQCDPRYRANLDYRCDLYSLALTVFEYAAHQHPVANDRDDVIRTVTRALHEPPKKLNSLRTEFSDAFCKLIDQLLKKRPSLRPANLKQLIQSMEK